MVLNLEDKYWVIFLAKIKLLEKIEEENKEIDNEEKENEEDVNIKILEKKEDNGEIKYKIDIKGKEPVGISKGESIVYDALIDEFENQDGGGWFAKLRLI